MKNLLLISTFLFALSSIGYSQAQTYNDNVTVEGNLGIGLSVPLERQLNIYSGTGNDNSELGLGFNTLSSNVTQLIDFKASGTSQGAISFSHADNALSFRAANLLKYTIGTSEVARFNSQGYFGIGYDDPGYALDVYGDINASNEYKIGGVTVLSLKGNRNIFIGRWAGTSNNGGQENMFLGDNAGGLNTTGGKNAFLGTQAGYNNTEGSGNTFIGYQAGYSYVETGINSGYNIMIGTNAGRSKKTGRHNTFIGIGAGNYPIQDEQDPGATGSGNVFIGYAAGKRELGSNKLYIENRDRYQESDGTYNYYDPLLYGDFATGQLAINTTEIASGDALTVGGNLKVNGTINGVDIANLNSSLWTQDQSDNDLNYTSGNVVIGTSSGAKNLYVHGLVNTTEVNVEPTITVPDYVFAEDYDLPTLQDTENYIKANHHLPEIPSAAEMEKEGMNLGVMNLKLLKKIEELTLHMIDLQKQNEDLKERMNKLEKKK